MIFLVTGSNGFIGANLCRRLLQNPANTVIGIDDMNDYYDITLKEERLELLRQIPTFKFIRGDIKEKHFIDALFRTYRPNIVVHLAAQAGVRYSVTNPDAYINSNLIGFHNILETCKTYKVQHFIYASSSSVYGNETDGSTDKPMSLYAATKKSNELMAHAYSTSYGIPCTALRLFTVYGSYGRPDMAYYKFTKILMNGQKIQLFNNGDNLRDLTHIDDAINGIMRIVESKPKTLYNVYDIGCGNPISTMDMVRSIINGMKEENMIPNEVDFNDCVEYVDKQLGDVEHTKANTKQLKDDFNLELSTSFNDGIHEFLKWYKENENNIIK
jgi:nucleoside-diphosphate-sugar epimerase